MLTSFSEVRNNIAIAPCCFVFEDQGVIAKGIPMSNSAEQRIMEIVQKYADDTPYWRFVENFKNTVGFQEAGHDEYKKAALLQECARQYEYIRTAHPEYFRDLTERKGDELSVLAGIVDWVVVKNLPMMHFAGFNSTKFAAAVHAKQFEYGEEFPIAGAEATPDYVQDNSAEEPVFVQEPIDENASVPANEQKQTFTIEELVEKALKTYQDKLGQIICVTEYAVSSYFSGTRKTENGPPYELALVVETQNEELAIVEKDEEGLPYVRATWTIKLLTGPVAEQTGFVHSLGIHADGAFGGEVLFTGHHIDELGYRSLSHEDLVTLAWRDAKAISGNQVYVRSCCGYYKDTDESHYIELDPPAVVTGDPISIETFRIGCDHPKYQIRDFDKDNDVVDWDFDFTSDDPRLKDYRTMWAGPPSYYQSGKMDSNEIVVGYDPKQDLDKEPTIFTMR
jgi:hypothetical protein